MRVEATTPRSGIPGSDAQQGSLVAYPSPLHALRATSLHLDILWRDGQSRLVLHGTIPTVYLSCEVNFIRDERTGEMFRAFGIWFGWIICEGHLFVLDLQSSKKSASLEESVAKLCWPQAARPEVFYAACRSDCARIFSTAFFCAKGEWCPGKLHNKKRVSYAEIQKVPQYL